METPANAPVSTEGRSNTSLAVKSIVFNFRTYWLPGVYIISLAGSFVKNIGWLSACNTRRYLFLRRVFGFLYKLLFLLVFFILVGLAIFSTPLSIASIVSFPPPLLSCFISPYCLHISSIFFFG